MRGPRVASIIREAVTAPDPDAPATVDATDSSAAALALQPPLRRRLLAPAYWLAYRLRAFLATEVRHDLARVQEAQTDLRRSVDEALAAADGRATALAAELHAVRADVQRVLAGAGRQAGALDQIGEHTSTLLGLIGPRFDELEVKIRPVMEYDAASYAIRLADGYAMVPRNEPAFAVMIANAPSGGLEAGTRRVLQALIAPGMKVADVGANIGLLTLASARATGPSGRVYAYEPEDGPRAQLEKTCALNGLSWVTIRDAAAGRRRQRRAFFVSPVIGHSSLYPLPDDETAAARKMTVQVVSLDQDIPADEVLDVVKIDVEGAELDVLAGMSRHLGNPDLGLVAEFGPSHLARLKVDPQQWWAAFKAYGLNPYAIAEPSGVCTPIALADALAAASTNIAWVRPGRAAHARLPRH